MLLVTALIYRLAGSCLTCCQAVARLLSLIVQYLVAALSESPSDSFRFDTLFDYGVFSIQLPARV